MDGMLMADELPMMMLQVTQLVSVASDEIYLVSR